MALKTRKPTGAGLFPKILIEGPEKTGKSYPLAELSASPKVGRTVVLILGEDPSKWDDFGKIRGARFEIIEHDCTWRGVLQAVDDAREEAVRAAANGEPPFVLGFDTLTAENEMNKDWASLRARNTRENKKLLAENPDAEIVVSPNFWNDANARHGQLMAKLLTFPGIVVLIARGEEVALFRDGKPVAGQTAWSIQAAKRIGYDVTAHVRLKRNPQTERVTADLISAAGVDSPVKPGDAPIRLEPRWKLEHLIFDILKFDPCTAAAAPLMEPQTGQLTPEQILGEARKPETSFARVKELHGEALNLRYDGVVLADERGQDELLVDQLIRIGKAKQQAEWRAAAERAAQAKEQALKALDPDDPWLQPISDVSDPGTLEALRAEFAETFAGKPDDDPRKKWLGVLLDLKEAELKRSGPRAASGPARDTGPHASGGGAPGTPEQWASAFRDRLRAAGPDNPDVFTALRGEINTALTKKTIPPRIASELHQAVSDHVKQSGEKAAA